jgi:hypothetical protein
MSDVTGWVFLIASSFSSPLDVSPPVSFLPRWLPLPGITVANCQRLRPGMTLAEVEALFGQPVHKVWDYRRSGPPPGLCISSVRCMGERSPDRAGRLAARCCTHKIRSSNEHGV